MSKLPKAVTTVTPLSLLLTGICFLTFPFLGFALGVLYQKGFEPQIYYITETGTSLAEKRDYTEEITDRCGALPSEDELGLERGGTNMFISIVGPMWSPDCRNVAWTSSQFPGMTPGEREVPSGLSVYNEADSKTALVVSAASLPEAPILKGWKSNREIWFVMSGQNYTYDVVTKITQLSQM